MQRTVVVRCGAAYEIGVVKEGSALYSRPLFQCAGARWWRVIARAVSNVIGSV